MKWIVAELEYKDVLGEWAKERIKYVQTWGEFRAIGLIDEEQILAVIVYNDFCEGGCAIHIAAVPGKRWLTREFLKAAFEYPFVQLGYRRLSGYVASKNLAAQKLDEHLGFRRCGLLREMVFDDDVIMYEMLKRECRFIGKEHVRKERSAITA